MVRNQKTAGKVARITSKEAQNMQDDLGNKGGQKLRETSPGERYGGEFPEKWSRKCTNMATRKEDSSNDPVSRIYLVSSMQKPIPSTVEWDL